MIQTVTDAAAALRAGTTTSVELTRAAIAAADASDAEVGTYLHRLDEYALDRAAEADAELARGEDRGPLHGIPVGVKDIIAMAEGPTTAQSLVLDRGWGQGDAPVVARLRAAGAVITGKSTTMEFAIGIPDDTKPFPIPRNPWNTDHYPGGSSSGTGNGVAAGFFLGGLGTDTGGSIRYPATSCGITGLKQTFGRVPKYGCVPLGYSYDHIGPMARSAEDCAFMLAVLAGHDPRDATSADRPVDDYLSALTGDLSGMRIGLDLLEGRSTRVDPEYVDLVNAAVVELEAAGATVVPIELPYYEEITFATMMGLQAEAYAYHRPDLQSRWGSYFAGTRAAVVAGALVPAGDYAQSQRARRAVQRLVAKIYDEVDLIVTPTASAGAPAYSELSFDGLLDPLHTPYWNALGNPAMSVPMGFSNAGLPIGLQIVGKPFDEAAVLAAGYAYQQRTDWHVRVPPMVAEHF